MNDEIMVSICCLVYNHEKYLRKCLNGFMMQKTNFKFEVLIHDDASTDGSADIIREYEKKYPDIIKPIYQKENQYSKGVKISWTFQYPRARGKYIAFCEGDDFWTSPYKLQRQFDYMQTNKNVGICVHQVARYSMESKFFSFQTNQFADRDYSVDEVILGGGGLFGTNSYFLRTKDLLAMPSCFYMKGMGDFQLVVYGTICGGCHFMKEVMSCYRTDVRSSFTDRHKNDLELRIEFCKNKLDMLDRVNEYYGKKYDNSIRQNASVTEYYLKMYLNEKNGSIVSSQVSNSKSIKQKIKQWIPIVLKIKQRISSNKVKKEIKRGAEA